LEEFSNSINEFEDLPKNFPLIISNPKEIIGEWRIAYKGKEITTKEKLI
jgi:hypothetical protein